MTAHKPVIAVTAKINAFVTVDAGMYEPTRVGERTFIMAHCHVGHDCDVGDDCELAAGSVLAGHVTLENGVRCGVGVVIRPFIRVGAGARLGSGAVVVKDVPAGEVWVGNPARRLVRPLATGEVLTESEELGWEQYASTRGC